MNALIVFINSDFTRILSRYMTDRAECNAINAKRLKAIMI